jgi:hypothetical protein
VTYCFAFRVPSSGIGVFADSRITLISDTGHLNFSDGECKIFSPNSNCFFVFAGDVVAVKALLAGVTEFFEKNPPHLWYANLQGHLGLTWLAAVRDSHALREARATVLYGDAYITRGRARYRLRYFNFGGFQTDANGTKALIGINHHPIESKGIGTILPLRKTLTEAANASLSDLWNSPFTITEVAVPSEMANEEWAFLTDRSGPIKFPQTMRTFARDFRETNKIEPPFNDISILLLAAQGAVHDELVWAKAKQEPGAETIGGEWYLATLKLPEGFKLFQSPEFMPNR